MRKIDNPSSREKRKRRNNTIIGLLLVALMIFSSVGFALVFHGQGVDPSSNSGTSEEKIDYKGVEFTRNQYGFWQSVIQGGAFITVYNPTETEDIEFDPQLYISDFLNKPLYYIVEDENSDALRELEQNIGRLSTRSQYEGICLEGGECEDEDFAVKNCSEDNVIILRDSEGTKTYKDGNCIFIEAPKSEHLIISDKLIFRSLGLQ